MLGYENPREHHTNDELHAKGTLGGLTLFAVFATFLILAAVFSERACS